MTARAIRPAFISIHAPRVGSDPDDANCAGRANDFNPRSPCGERFAQVFVIARHIAFQSTLPVWGATPTLFLTSSCSRYFNPRSPCGERRVTSAFMLRSFAISIHAPRVGSDLQRDTILPRYRNFNPRSPCGERLRKTIISIPFSEKNRYIFSENDSAAQNRAGFCAIFHILMWISGANLPEKFCSLQVRTK